MKQHIKNCISSIFLFLLLLVILPGAARAEDKEENTKTVYYDYSEDQASYGAQVAELIRQGEQTGEQGEPPFGAKRGEESGQAPFAVLCRAEDGFKPDFEKWSPVYVVAGPRNCYTLFFRDEKEATTACEELSKTEGIRYAEPDEEITACETETTFHSWGATQMNYGEYVDYSAQWGDGSVTVAVIDSGVSRHPFLTDRLITGGHDYGDNDDDSTSDPFGHGTNVAGVVADCTPGAAVMIYPIRVLNESGGGKTSNVSNAIREATQAGVRIINLSLEGKTFQTLWMRPSWTLSQPK